MSTSDEVKDERTYELMSSFSPIGCVLVVDGMMSTEFL